MTLENTVQLVRIVVTLRVPPVLMPSERTNAKHVTLERTVQLVRTLAPIVSLENTTANPAKQVAKHVGLERTAQLVRQVAPIVMLERTVQLVRTVVTILTLRVQPVLIPTERTNVSNVGLERTVQLVRTVAPFVEQVRTAQLVRQVAPLAGLEHTNTTPARQV